MKKTLLLFCLGMYCPMNKDVRLALDREASIFPETEKRNPTFLLGIANNDDAELPLTRLAACDLLYKLPNCQEQAMEIASKIGKLRCWRHSILNPVSELQLAWAAGNLIAAQDSNTQTNPSTDTIALQASNTANTSPANTASVETRRETQPQTAGVTNIRVRGSRDTIASQASNTSRAPRIDPIREILDEQSTAAAKEANLIRILQHGNLQEKLGGMSAWNMSDTTNPAWNISANLQTAVVASCIAILANTSISDSDKLSAAYYLKQWGKSQETTDEAISQMLSLNRINLDFDDLIFMGEIMHASSKIAEAINLARTSLKSDNDLIKIKAAELLYKCNQQNEAKSITKNLFDKMIAQRYGADFKEIEKLKTNRLMLSYTLSQFEQLEEAKRLIESVLPLFNPDQNENDAIDILFCAKILYKCGDHAGAKKLAEQVAKLNDQPTAQQIAKAFLAFIGTNATVA